MDTKTRDQTLPGYPVTASSSGSPVSGYPVSQFHLPVTATADASAAETTWSTDSPSTSKTIKKISSRLCCIFFFLVLLSAVVVLFVVASQVPNLPHVALITVSATVRNASTDRITADFDTTFMVQNRADKAMAFDHLVMYVSAFKAEVGPLPPFELRSGENKTVTFENNDRSYRVDKTDEVGEFGMWGNVKYKGWLKRRIPITVRCGSVKFLFSYNDTDWQPLQTVHLDKDSGFCLTDGHWL